MKYKTGTFLTLEGKEGSFLIIGYGSENGYNYYILKNTKNGNTETLLEDFIEKLAEVQHFNFLKYFILIILTTWKKQEK